MKSNILSTIEKIKRRIKELEAMKATHDEKLFNELQDLKVTLKNLERLITNY